MYAQPLPLIPNTSPWTNPSGSTATAAIGQIVAMNVVTSMSRRECLVDVTYPTSSSIAIRPKRLPSSDASPWAGALNSTRATPPNATSANTSARGSIHSLNSAAPAGTMRNGASEPMRAALATLLCVAPAKNTARFRPKKTPGRNTWRTSAIVTRRPLLQSTTFQTMLTVTIRQKATRTPGDSARFTRVELSENATTSPRTASTPNAFALRRSCSGGAGVDMPPPPAQAPSPPPTPGLSAARPIRSQTHTKPSDGGDRTLIGERVDQLDRGAGRAQDVRLGVGETMREHVPQLADRPDQAQPAHRQLRVVDEQRALAGLRDHRPLDLRLQRVGVGHHPVGGYALRAQEQPVGEVALHGPDRERPDERARQPPQRAAHADQLEVRPALVEHELHHREAVGEHGARESRLDDPARDEVARRRGVEEHRLSRRHARDRRLGEPLL